MQHFFLCPIFLTAQRGLPAPAPEAPITESAGATMKRENKAVECSGRKGHFNSLSVAAAAAAEILGRKKRERDWIGRNKSRDEKSNSSQGRGKYRRRQEREQAQGQTGRGEVRQPSCRRRDNNLSLVLVRPLNACCGPRGERAGKRSGHSNRTSILRPTAMPDQV